MKQLRSLLDLIRPQHPRATDHVGWPTLFLPRTVADETACLVSSFGTGEDQHEGVVYWAGVASADSWVVTTVLVPEARTTAGSFHTSVLANSRVIQAVNDAKLQLLAQVHGHPGDWVGHSGGDDRGAFMPYRGFYSVVLPHYGSCGLLPLDQCGFHRYDGRRFNQLTASEVAELIVLVDPSSDLRRRV